MKKFSKLLVAMAVAVATIVAAVALAGCGGKSAKLVGVYKEYHTTNHNTSGGGAAMELGYQWEYTLSVYSDNTYVMEYNAFYAIQQMTGNCNRTVVQYGKYTVADGAEEGQVVYELGIPTRVVFFAMYGGSNGAPTQVTAYADTDNWDAVNPMDEDGFFTYQLNSRSLVETYETAIQLINTVGRTYKAVCQSGDLHRMVVEVTSHGGENINGYDNIFPSEDKDVVNFPA